MLIRCRGYNAGVKEYLEEGLKSGRELTRDELDERVILDGNLNLTEMIYKDIPDRGQDRYLSFTLAFKEDKISNENLFAITQEFKSFLMDAYATDEFNFYAEAHLPKVKTLQDKKTGEEVERKPHIHIVIPRKNLLSGNEMNPVGDYKQNEKYLEAFQEYINQKYHLASPRDNMRIAPTGYADMLSRYKGDDFRAKNKEFKTQLLERVCQEDIRSREAFYNLVSQYGESKIRNAGKPSEYIAVKLEGDSKFTNLKESIFSDEFIVNRKITRPPLKKEDIASRFDEWKVRSHEIKYIDKIASPKLRDLYYSSEEADRKVLLSDCVDKFISKYRGNNVRSERKSDYQPSAVKPEGRFTPSPAYSLQNMPLSDVAGTRQEQRNKVLLQGDARLHLANQQTNGNSGLRRPVRGGGGGGRTASTAEHRSPNRATGATLRSVGQRTKRRTKLQLGSSPVIPRIKNRVPTLADIQRRGSFLFVAGEISDGSKKLPFIKPKNADVNVSSVPAWLIRRNSLPNQLQSNNNKLLRMIDRDFYDIRKEVLTDNRFTHDEKTQLLSVLHFERMKKKEAVSLNQKVQYMGSKDIRELIDRNRKETYGFTISAPEKEDPQPARARFAEAIKTIQDPVDYAKVANDARKTVEKQLDASNLYTKRNRKGHVHYLDKTKDKTLFVDTGKLITMRKNGISKDSVAIALELAQGRFGSTLNIKGSKQFKDLVVSVVAERGLDIHFTDKKMNAAVELRRQELAKAKENQPATATDRESAFTIEGAEPARAQSTTEYQGHDRSEQKPAAGSAAPHDQDDGPLYRSVETFQGTIVKHGAAPYLHKPGNSANYYVTLKDKEGNESTQWGVGLKDALKGFRRGHEVSLELKSSKPVQVTYRDENGKTGTREAVRNTWAATRLNVPQSRKAVEQAEAAKGQAQADTHQEQTMKEPAQQLDLPEGKTLAVKGPAPQPVQLEGKIVAHGAAPYLNEEGNSDSYYVTLEKDGEQTTQWGVGIKDALSGFKRGNQISLELTRTEQVQVKIKGDDGKIRVQDATKNIWQATRLDGPQPKDTKDNNHGLKTAERSDNSPDFA